MTNPSVVSSPLEKARRRLNRQYRKIGTWRKVAQVLSEKSGLEINVRYPYEFAVRGTVPANKQIQRALGIPQRHTLTTEQVNRHLAHDSLQDMPALILAYAITHRVEMTA